MQKLKASLNLSDGWRLANRNDINFTWKGKTNDDTSFARIDRIYASESLLPFTNEWNIILTEDSISDHAAVSVKVLEPDPPIIGTGEWRLNLKVLEHPHFMKEATRLIVKAESDLRKYEAKLNRNKHRSHTENLRSHINPQLIWVKYKRGLKRAAEEAQAIRRSAILKERRKLERQAKRTKTNLSKNPPQEEQKTLRTQLANIEKDLSNLMETNREKAEATIAARWFKESESGSKL